MPKRRKDHSMGTPEIVKARKMDQNLVLERIVDNLGAGIDSRPSQARPSDQGSRTNTPVPEIKMEPGSFVKEESQEAVNRITVLRDPCPPHGRPHRRKGYRQHTMAGKKRIDKWRGKAKTVTGERKLGFYGDRETERNNNDESLYANGHFAIVRIPDPLKEKMDENNFVSCCQYSGIVKPGLQVGPLSNQYWSLRFDNPEDVNSIVGKHVRFMKELGMERVVDQKILHYVRNGPRAFYLTNVGPYSDQDVQGMVEKRFKDEKFWMGKKMVVGVSTHRRLLLFENNQALNSFDLGADRGFVLRFNAVSRIKFCDFCGKEHDGGMTSCTFLYPCNSSPNLHTRLSQRPF